MAHRINNTNSRRSSCKICSSHHRIILRFSSLQPTRPARHLGCSDLGNSIIDTEGNPRPKCKRQYPKQKRSRIFHLI